MHRKKKKTCAIRRTRRQSWLPSHGDHSTPSTLHLLRLIEPTPAANWTMYYFDVFPSFSSLLWLHLSSSLACYIPPHSSLTAHVGHLKVLLFHDQTQQATLPSVYCTICKITASQRRLRSGLGITATPYSAEKADWTSSLTKTRHFFAWVICILTNTYPGSR